MKLVVLVPGFAASHLYRQDASGERRDKIWLSQLDIAWSGITSLDTDQAVSPTNLNRVVPGELLHAVYWPFLAFMDVLGVRVNRYSYDWRADVLTNGQRLALVLEEYKTDDVEITVVGHSMGGLVAAAAVNRLSEQAVQKVKRVITCATPWAGSFWTIELFTGHHDIVQYVVNLNRILSRWSREEWRRDSVRVVASWPGAYDLLPMPELLTAYPPGPGQDFRFDHTLGLVNPWFNIARYNEAVARRPIHIGFPAGVTHHNFRGIGRITPGPSPSVFDGEPSHYFLALLGDGAVPEVSSRAPVPFNALERDFDADHEQFLNDSNVLRSIARYVGVLG